jgi:hypothetical protein
MSGRLKGVLAVVGIVLLGAVALLAAQATRPGDTMQLWEYRTEITRGPASPGATDSRSDLRRGGSSSADSLLNSLGRDGWELVAVTRREIRVDDLLQTEASYTFKRATRSINR